MPDTTDRLPADVLAAAVDAAIAVFDRALKLYSPNRVFVEEAVTAVAATLDRRHEGLRARLAAAVETARHLNEPMVARLRACAADTSPNWDGAITVYPPEAAGLVTLIDLLTDPDPEAEPGETLAVRHARLRDALKDVVIATSTTWCNPADALDAIKNRAVSVLHADLP